MSITLRVSARCLFNTSTTAYNAVSQAISTERTKDFITPFAWHFCDGYLDGVMMNTINESQSEFRQKIGNYLEQCAPDQLSISLDRLANLLPLSLRELAWIIAIAEGKYSYVAIPWELSSLKDRVEVLNNIFLTTITQEVADHASSDQMKSFSFDARTDAIYKLMGIRWEIAHDYTGKGVPTYWILSINNTEQLKSIIVRLLSSIRSKMVTPAFEPVQMMPHIKRHNKQVRSNQIIHLINKICLEQPIRIDPVKISESIQSYNLAWIIVICHRGLDWIEEVKLQELELTPLADITNGKIMNYLQQLGHLHKLKVKCFDEVDLRDSGAVKKIFSYEIPPALLLELISHDSIYRIKNNLGSDTNHRPASPFPGSSTTIIINAQNTTHVDARTFNTEIAYTKAPEQASCDQPTNSKSSRMDILSEAISRKIFPILKSEDHKITANTAFAKLCWEKLDSALNAIGCTEVEVEPLGSACTQDLLTFKAKHKTLTIPSNNFKAFRQRITRMAKN